MNDAGVAQLVERNLAKVDVTGSNPASRLFTPVEKATEFIRWSSPYKVDGGLMPPLARTVRERNSLTGFTLAWKFSLYF